MDKDEELKKIKRLRNLIENTYKNNLKTLLIDDYLNLKENLIEKGIVSEDYFGEENYEFEELQYNLDDKVFSDAYDNLFDNMEKIIEITNNVINLHKKYPINLNCFHESKIRISDKKEIKSITYEFFKSLGNDVLNLYLKMLQMKNIYIKPMNESLNYDGICNNVAFYDNPRIIVYDKKNPLKLFGIISHEMGHCYEFVRNKTNKRKCKYNFLVEVPSILFEKLFCLYLIENGFYKDDGIINLIESKQNILRMNTVNKFVNDAYCNDLILYNSSEYGNIDIDSSAFFGLPMDVFENVNAFGTSIDNYGYVLSDIVSNNLIEKYLSNKKEGLKEIKDFITTMYQYSFYENLNRYGKNLKNTEKEMKELYNYQKKKFYL